MNVCLCGVCICECVCMCVCLCGVCVCECVCMCVSMVSVCVLVTQSCPTPRNLPCRGILQERTLEWVAISFFAVKYICIYKPSVMSKTEFK